MLSQLNTTVPGFVLPLTTTLPVPFGVKLISPLDTDKISDITLLDVKVLFVSVCVPVRVTSPILAGCTTVNVIVSDPNDASESVVHKTFFLH